MFWKFMNFRVSDYRKKYYERKRKRQLRKGKWHRVLKQYFQRP